MSKKCYRFFGGLLNAQAKWLNKMSEKGYQLVRTGTLLYEFEKCKPDEVTYCVEFIGEKSKENATDYADFLEDMGYKVFFKNINLNYPEISFSTMPLPFESREEVLAWICKNQLGRRNLTPEQKKFLIGKQYSVEHRKPGGNGNNQHTAAAKKTAPEELCQFGTIPPTSAEASIRKQIAERNNVSESYVARSEKFMHGVEILEQMVPGMQEKILSGQFKVRDADLHRLAKADYIDRQKIVDEILYPERKVEPKPNTNGAAPEPGKAPYMPMLKIESVYDSDAYPKDVRYEYVALENITTRFRTEFDYQLKIMPDTAQREVILEIIHKHKEYLAFLESALAEDAQTA